MKPKVLAILAAATGAVLLVGVLATRGTGGSAPDATKGQIGDVMKAGDALFPDLRANAEAIVELRVSQGERVARIVRDDGSNDWRVATLGGYPANSERVRDTVRSMVEAKVLERKTARKESLAAVGLDDPDSSSRAILVEAIDAKGNALAKLVLGDLATPSTPTFDPNNTSRFVRRGDEDQSYIVGGRFPADPASTAWVVRSIIEIPGERVREVQIAPASGAGLIAARDKAGDELVLRDVPVGRTIKDQTQIARLAQVFAFLTLESVSSADDPAFANDFDAATTFDVTTFDHLRIRARVTERDGAYWAKLEAAPEPVASPAAPARNEGEASAPAANTEVSIDDPPPSGDSSVSGGGEPSNQHPSRDAARAEAAILNAKLAPWIFRLSQSKGEQLTLTRDDVLTPAAVQGPELPVPQTQEPPAVAPAPLPSPAPAESEPGVDPAKVLFPDSRP